MLLLRFLTSDKHESVIKILAARYNLDNIILTRRGGEGIFYDGDSFAAIPALGFDDQEDVIGVSGAFFAAFVIALICGLPPGDAMLYSSIVAGYVWSLGWNMPKIPPEYGLVACDEMENSKVADGNND